MLTAGLRQPLLLKGAWPHTHTHHPACDCRCNCDCQRRRFLSGLVMNVFTPALLFSKLGASGECIMRVWQRRP